MNPVNSFSYVLSSSRWYSHAAVRVNVVLHFLVHAQGTFFKDKGSLSCHDFLSLTMCSLDYNIRMNHIEKDQGGWRHLHWNFQLQLVWLIQY